METGQGAAEPGQEAGAPGEPTAAQRPGAATSERPRRGGTLRLPGGSPSTLDPAHARDVTSAEYIYEIFSGLVTLTPDLEVVGDLAESWEVHPGGTVYTFSLRTDASFHDGRPVTSRDVRFSIERTCDPATGSTVAATYLGDVVGCLQKLAGAANDVAGITVPDEHTIVVRIDEPKAYFLSKLTYPTAFVVDEHEARGALPALPNGTGPFSIESYERDNRLVLVRHEGYHGEGPWLDEVRFDLRPVVSGTMYENGELDATPVGIGDIDRVRDPLNPLSLELVEGPGELGVTYLAFDVRRPPMDELALRRAIHYAVDRDWLARIVLRGGVKPLGTILPPGMPGYNEARALAPNADEARASLAQSPTYGRGGGQPLVLTIPGEGGGNPVASAVADAISETLGIGVVIEQAPWELFQDELSAGAYDMWILGWSADYPDPQDFLDVLFHGSAPLNSTGFADAEVDALLESARTETDSGRRRDAYARAEVRILEASPWVPLFTGLETWLVKPYVRGFVVPALTLPRLARAWMTE